GFEGDPASVLVMRGDDGVIPALHNPCRHRGMKLCAAASGHVARLVCPYHQWSYSRHGTLLTCGGMDADGDLDRRDFNLRGVHAREVGGLHFVCLADDPIPLDGPGPAP